MMKIAREVTVVMIVIAFITLAFPFFDDESVLTRLAGAVTNPSEVEESNYIIFINGTTINAKNGKTGLIEFSGSNASTVIQSALDTVGNAGGGKVTLREGSYNLTSGLTIKSDTILEGIGKQVSVLRANAAINTLKIEDGAKHVVIRDLFIDQDKKSGHAIFYDTGTDSAAKKLTRSLIDNVLIKQVPSGKWSIIIDYISDSTLMNIQMIDVGNGLLLNNTGDGRGGNSVLMGLVVIADKGNNIGYSFQGQPETTTTKPINLINAYNLNYFNRNLTGVNTAFYGKNFDFSSIYGISFEHWDRGIVMDSSHYVRFYGGYLGGNSTYSDKVGIRVGNQTEGNVFQNLRIGSQFSGGIAIDEEPNDIGPDGNQYIGNKITSSWSTKVNNPSISSFFEKNVGYTDGYPLDKLTSDPSSLPFGKIWYNNGTGSFKYKDGSASRTVVATDATQTLTQKTIRATSNIITADPSLAILTALGATTPSTNPAAKTRVDGTNFSYFVLDYDQTTQETAFWTFEVPPDLDSSADITVKVRFISSTSTGGVCFAGAFRGVTDNEAWDGTFTSTQTSCDTTLNASGNINEISISFTSAQHGLAGGDTVQFRLQRDPTNGSDTMTADARVLDTRVLWN